MVENLYNLVSGYVRQWLELPISSTLVLPNTKYGLGFILPSTKFIQCQTVIRNALKSSPSKDINSLWAQTSFGCNIQYNQFQNTKQVLNAIKKDNEARINHELKSQGFIISSILSHASQKTRSLWSTIQQHMPKNIFNFTIKYLNNTLATRKNRNKWAISQSSACSFCLKAETLQHVVSSCTVNLEEGRYTWHHNSILLFLAKTLLASQLYTSISSKNAFLFGQLFNICQSSIIVITKLHNRRPDLALLINNSSLYIIELTVGLESNVQINSDRKRTKYNFLISDVTPAYTNVTFVN